MESGQGTAPEAGTLDSRMALLRRIPLFANLPQPEIALLGKRLEPRNYRRGDVVCHQGDPGDHLFVVANGQVRVYTLTLDGVEVSVDILAEGDFFGEMAILDGLARSANVVATRPTQILLLRRSDFLAHLMAYPQTAVRVIEAISRRLRHTLEYAEELVSMDVRRRVIKKLIELSERHGIPEAGEGAVLIDADLTQDTLASLTGTTRETVNRLLGDLRDRGIVRSDRARLVIVEAGELRRLLRE
jgi:CRP/FNR family cyclic AMP-dependent transcriptional regulator